MQITCYTSSSRQRVYRRVPDSSYPYQTRFADTYVLQSRIRSKWTLFVVVERQEHIVVEPSMG